MQLTLQLKPGLTQQYRTLRECTAACVYQYRGGISGAAGHVDMSPSELGRRLAHGESDPQRSLDIDDWVDLIDGMQDFRPIFWLIERFLPNDEQKRAAAVDRIQQLLPELVDLVKSAAPTKARR